MEGRLHKGLGSNVSLISQNSISDGILVLPSFVESNKYQHTSSKYEVY